MYRNTLGGRVDRCTFRTHRLHPQRVSSSPDLWAKCLRQLLCKAVASLGQSRGLILEEEEEEEEGEEDNKLYEHRIRPQRTQQHTQDSGGTEQAPIRSRWTARVGSKRTHTAQASSSVVVQCTACSARTRASLVEQPESIDDFAGPIVVACCHHLYHPHKLRQCYEAVHARTPSAGGVQCTVHIGAACTRHRGCQRVESSGATAEMQAKQGTGGEGWRE